MFTQTCPGPPLGAVAPLAVDGVAVGLGEVGGAGVTVGVVIIGALLAIGAIGAMQLKNDDRLSDESFVKLMIEWYKRLPLLRGDGS